MPVPEAVRGAAVAAFALRPGGEVLALHTEGWASGPGGERARLLGFGNSQGISVAVEVQARGDDHVRLLVDLGAGGPFTVEARGQEPRLRLVVAGEGQLVLDEVERGPTALLITTPGSGEVATGPWQTSWTAL